MSFKVSGSEPSFNWEWIKIKSKNEKDLEREFADKYEVLMQYVEDQELELIKPEDRGPVTNFLENLFSKKVQEFQLIFEKENRFQGFSYFDDMCFKSYDEYINGKTFKFKDYVGNEYITLHNIYKNLITDTQKFSFIKTQFLQYSNLLDEYDDYYEPYELGFYEKIFRRGFNDIEPFKILFSKLNSGSIKNFGAFETEEANVLLNEYKNFQTEHEKFILLKSAFNLYIEPSSLWGLNEELIYKKRQEIRTFMSKIFNEFNTESITIADKNPVFSFSITTKHEKEYLKIIRSKLIDNGFIDEKITLPNFKALFNNVNTKEIVRIEWKESIGSLRYFIKKIPLHLKEELLFNITTELFTKNQEIITMVQLENNKSISSADKKEIDLIFEYYPKK